jgi:hypothetical protein
MQGQGLYLLYSAIVTIVVSLVLGWYFYWRTNKLTIQINKNMKDFQIGIAEQLFQEQRQQRNEPINPSHLGIGKDGKPCTVFELGRTEHIITNNNCEVAKKEN